MFRRDSARAIIAAVCALPIAVFTRSETIRWVLVGFAVALLLTAIINFRRGD